MVTNNSSSCVSYGSVSCTPMSSGTPVLFRKAAIFNFRVMPYAWNPRSRCACLDPWRETSGMIQYKMTSYQYMKSHCGDKTVVRSSYLHNGISYTGKMTYLYWIRAQKASPGETHTEIMIQTVASRTVPHGPLWKSPFVYSDKNACNLWLYFKAFTFGERIYLVKKITLSLSLGTIYSSKWNNKLASLQILFSKSSHDGVV